MWARVVEVMLGCWLAVSPFVFRHGEHTLLWTADFLFASAVAGLALLSCWPPARRAHLATIFVSLAMVVFGRVAGGWHPAAGFQNHIVTGFLLLMFSLVPNHASMPPRAWFSSADERRKRRLQPAEQAD